MGFEGFILQPVANRYPQGEMGGGGGGGVHGVKEEKMVEEMFVRCDWFHNVTEWWAGQGHLPGGQGLPNEDLIESSDRQ